MATDLFNLASPVVRSSYSDRVFAELAREAIVLWKDHKKWGDTYHE